MSLVRTAVRGAAWTTFTSILARGFSLLATLLVTHKIAPGEYGQAAAAAVVVLSANWLSSPFLPNYLIIDRDRSPSAAWHANWVHQVCGWVALGATIPLAPWLGHLLGAPDLPRYLPGAALAIAIDRLGIVPEKILVRDLRFRHLALTRMAGEMTYGFVTIIAAQLGWGGMALITGMLLRSIIKSGLFVLAVPWREWSKPFAYDGVLMRRMVDYGLPLWLGGITSYIGANWDNLVVSRYFGPAVMATYSLAFNLAEMPAAQIGEQLCEVLLPSFAILPPERRPPALVKSLLVVVLVTFPLAVGLGSVSDTLVRAFFDVRWAGVAPMLALLSVRALSRTVFYPIAQYLQSIDRTRDQMKLAICHTALLLVVLVALGGRSPILTCIGVVSCHILIALFSVIIVAKEGVPVGPMTLGILRVMLACAVMVAAVLGARHLLQSMLPPWLLLCAEIVAGGIAYVPAAFMLCAEPTHDLLSWLWRGLGRSPTVEEA